MTTVSAIRQVSTLTARLLTGWVNRRLTEASLAPVSRRVALATTAAVGAAGAAALGCRDSAGTGRVGLLVAAAELQTGAAFGLPHLLARIGLDRAPGAAADVARSLDPLARPTVLGGTLVLFAGLMLGRVALSGLDRGIRSVETELRAAQAALSRATCTTRPFPMDPVDALVAKDFRRIRRMGGPDSSSRLSAAH